MRTGFVMVLSVLLMGTLVWCLQSWESGNATGRGRQATETTGETDEPLQLYCAASNRAVMERVLEAYERETGRIVQVQYGASQTLLAQAQVTRSGDLYLPADDSYLHLARQDGLVREILPVADMRAGLVVRRGNPLGLQSVADLKRSGIRLVQASPEAAAIGKVTREHFERLGEWDSIAAATMAFRGTVVEVANDVKVGAADVGIVYDVVVHEAAEVEFVPIPELDAVVSRVAVGILAASQVPARALHFARYLTARDRGGRTYQDFGFTPVGHDPWAETPELTLFAGSMLRPAIEQTLNAFEVREGVRVSTVYNGCGILVAQMRAGQVPDAYFACDQEFMTQVQDLFSDPIAVSENELVILVPKGNPNRIASLRDLTRSTLRVGIGHEKQCAMGWITQNVFRESGMQKELMSNVVVQTPTGDMLVNQLRTGSLDAAVVYLSNAAGSAAYLDAVRIQGLPCSTAVQPWAISEASQYPELAHRLFTALSSTDSQETFSAEGFRWRLDDPVGNLTSAGGEGSND